jgi:hypothetical protein
MQAVQIQVDGSAVAGEVLHPSPTSRRRHAPSDASGSTPFITMISSFISTAWIA